MNRLLKKPETPKEQGRAAKPSLRSRIRHEWLQLERTRHWAVPGLVVTAIAICWLLFVVVGGHSPVSWLMTPDQQGERLMAQESYEEAAERFDSVELKGSALYRAGDFKQAAEVLARTDTPVAAYNRGTAQIILGEYDAAIASLDRALELRPEWKEAKENRAIAVARKKALEPGDGPREQGTEVGADELVFDEMGKKGTQDTTVDLNGDSKLNEEQLRAMWLRRVQTKPSQFLQAKFASQEAQRDAEASN